jgi:hypothetical protein
MIRNINYVICSYGGIYPRRFDDNNNHRFNILKKHLELLNLIDNNLTQISIMKPKISEGHIPIEGYYDFENLKIDNIRDKIKIIECENKGISYGQFLTCINKDYEIDNLFDYYIFNEDDYSPFIDNFDSILIEEYKKNENHFLCMGINVKDGKNTTRDWKSLNITVPDFAIGVLNKESVINLFNQASYDKIMEEILDIGYNSPMYFYQISFGYILNKYNIKITDTNENYLSLFYENCDKNFYIVNLDINNRRVNREYNDKKYKSPIFIPIDIFYINYERNKNLIYKFLENCKDFEERIELMKKIIF